METTCRQCQTRATESPRQRVTPGAPFVECPSCGTYVARPHFSEWATMSAALKTRNVAWCLLFATWVGLFVAATYTLWAMLARDGAQWPGVLLAFGVGALATGAWKAYGLGEAIRRSQRRMGDPMYTARLVEFELRRREAEVESRSAQGMGAARLRQAP